MQGLYPLLARAYSDFDVFAFTTFTDFVVMRCKLAYNACLSDKL